MGRGRPMIGTPEEAAERRRQLTAERVRRLRERRRAEVPQVAAAATVRANARPALTGNRLRNLVERIERLEKELGGLRTRNPALKDAYAAERLAVQDELRKTWDEAEAAGFAVEALRELIRLRKMPPADRAELERTVTLYKQALGMA